MTRQTTERATFAAGCFWGVEAAFRALPGVTDTRVGYTGGSVEVPTYEDVCRGDTGHAEAVEVTFDPRLVTYKKLLQTFFEIHDATQKDGQGLDMGTQYRSAIFYHTVTQKEIAEQELKQQQLGNERTIVTELEHITTFWPAEEYHQRYLEKNGGGHC